MTTHLLPILCQQANAVKILVHNDNVPLQPRQVLFIEDAFHPRTNEYITTHLSELTQRFELRGFTFLYLPALTLTPAQMAYWDPSRSQRAATLRLRASMLYDVIEAQLSAGHLPAIVLPDEDALPQRVLRGLTIDENDPSTAFDQFFELCDSEEEEVSCCMMDGCAEPCPSPIPPVAEREAVADIVVPKPKSSSKCPGLFKRMLHWDMETKGTCASEGSSREPAQEIEEEPLEPQLTEEEQQLIRDIQRNLDLLRAHGISESVFEKLFAPAVKPSRMRILKNGTILLPDYNNTVIDMIPLDKVLYLLLLRHPEGIYQKDLSDHIDEMKELYCRINNSFLPNRALAGILNLASPLSNSCNEKISRIRKVFQSHFQPAIAAFYTITGGRNEPKRIALDPSLVSFTT